MRTLFILLFSCYFGQAQFVDRFTPFATSGSIPVIESYTQVWSGSVGTSIVLNKPSGTVDGDLLIILAGNDIADSATDQFDATSDPSGWTFVKEDGDATSDNHVAMFWKIASSEGSTFTITALSSQDYWGACLRISGAHATTPIGVTGSSLSQTHTNPNNIPEITTINDNSLVIAFGGTDGSDTDPFTIAGTGWTEGDEITGADSTDDTNGVWAWKDMASAGATADCAWTLGKTDGVIAWQFSINPE